MVKHKIDIDFLKAAVYKIFRAIRPGRRARQPPARSPCSFCGPHRLRPQGRHARQRGQQAGRQLRTHRTRRGRQPSTHPRGRTLRRCQRHDESPGTRHRPRRKGHLHQRGDLLPGLLHGLLRPGPESVRPAPLVPVLLLKKTADHLRHRRLHRRGRITVQINRSSWHQRPTMPKTQPLFKPCYGIKNF